MSAARGAGYVSTVILRRLIQRACATRICPANGGESVELTHSPRSPDPPYRDQAMGD